MRWKPDTNGARLAVVLGMAILAGGVASGQDEAPAEDAPATESVAAPADDVVQDGIAAELRVLEDRSAQPWTPTERLVEFNRGIAAVTRRDFELAEKVFEDILARDPENPVATLYLALTNLKAGLELYKSSDAERREEALRRFRMAREQLERVARSDDPRMGALRVVETALILGIAQLAAESPEQLDDPEKRQAFVERTLDALGTFEDYVATDVGRSDRYGYFYLGVVRFRLGDHYDVRNDVLRSREYFKLADEAFRSASRYAETTLRVGESGVEEDAALAPEERDAFQTTINYYQALIALYRDDYAAGGVLLLQVIEASPEGSQVAANAATVLEAVEKRKSGGAQRIAFASPFGALEFEGSIQLGTAYDTNVILLGKDTQLPTSFSTDDDFTLDLTADFQVSRYFGQGEIPLGESLTVGLGGRVQYGYRPNITEFDVNQYAGRAFLNWEPITDLYLGLEYEYSFTQLGHDPFISSNRISPVVSKIWRRGDESGDEAGRTDVWYTYDYRNYLERIQSRSFNRDGRYSSIGARQVFYLARAGELYPEYYAAQEALPAYFAKQWLEASIGYVYRDERTIGTEFDLWGHSLFAGVVVPLPERWTFLFSTQFTWDHYTAASVFDYRRNARRDFRQDYEFWLRRTLVATGERPDMPTLKVELEAGVMLAFQNSNIWDRLGQDIYEYDRAIYALRLRVNF